ncbi:hypothetical protein QQS21_006289 [Conoideocrella luteorostrata]|uniref:ubiquitinyl hydrolase 1 n=1 Tax=Conoideocrella luteorostrata TaxID=1105319 RepID=A0AAJ0CNS9_9HYPO|nr:hypothetical protein QQS21_006289 [Conoideocrella luteorostrata]
MDSDRAKLLGEVFDHVVLPPKLLGELTEDRSSLNYDLTARLRDACRFLRHVGDANMWDSLDASLALMQQVNQNFLSNDGLHSALKKLTEEGAVEWLAAHIVEQNAAILIHKDKNTGEMMFESFETSASASSVLAANHALQWDFPGRAVAISMDEFANESFRNTLGEFLEQASEVAFDQFAARASKGGRSVVETRDTASPALITEMLMSFLEAKGRAVPSSLVRKRIRDDVILASSETQWRRSPYWLVLRVASQRIFQTLCGPDGHEAARVYFKFLMCVVLARLLVDCDDILHPENVLMLQAKLCRRLAKLEAERSAASSSRRQVYDECFSETTDFLESVVKNTKQKITTRWEAHQQKSARVIPRLPSRAPERDLTLELINSGDALQSLLESKVDAPRNAAAVSLSALQEGTVTQVNKLADRCSRLVDCAADAVSKLKHAEGPSEGNCKKIAEEMIYYLNALDTEFNGEAQLMSQSLLNLFELWVAMDSMATSICPLLSKYHPIFVPESLDMLCLSTKGEMERLSRVQQYLAKRIKSCTFNENIFRRGKSAFAVMYFHSEAQNSTLVALGAEIDAASSRNKKNKEEELQRLTKDYETLTEEMEQNICSCTHDSDGSRNVSGCKRCWKMRCRKRLRINVHEDFLPTNPSYRAAVLFEMGMPKYLAAYRAATWRLMMAGNQDQIPDNNFELLLSDFEPLQSFWDRQVFDETITMASPIKAFHQTHYRGLRLPTTLREVLLPFGPSFSYYDKLTDTWISKFLGKVPWYHHLMGTWLPKEVPDPFAVARSYMDSVERPSSYEIAASQTMCPPGMSPHEFTAYQRSISGVSRRWLVLVVELGSTNLNFSNEMTMKLFNRLALQAGPSCQDGDSSDILRKAHSIFKDITFCNRLEDQIRTRLDALATGRREINCMSILTTLCLRLYYLSPRVTQSHATVLLQKLRQLISNWIFQLREEVRRSDDAEAARKTACIGFSASLLCRQTFEIYSDENNEEEFGEKEAFQFFQASIALSENLVLNLNEVPSDIRCMLLRDLCTAYSMRAKIKQWTTGHPLALQNAINETWADAGSLALRSFSPWQFLSDDFWVVSRTARTATTASQTVHYHTLQGHLLVDGKPLGRLPLEMREDNSIQELFQGQHLLTRPSGLAGMEYQLVSNIFGHELHFGHRNGSVVIRAKFKGQLLEHVHRSVFQGSSRRTDLPSRLVDECVHWLDLNTGKLEMRQKPRIWHQKRSNWILDVCTRRVTRHNKSSLVEPYSSVGSKIVQIFRGFEDIDKLTIYQPPVGKLSVELKRLELSFFVNGRGLLQCRQLHSEIDPKQNIGTLHGLESKLVLRKTENSRRKSVVVPIGQVFYSERRDMHVSIKIANDGNYALFTVDPLLGRLDCVPEPTLLYLKAVIHALTSFPLPDDLTERTGTEEAHRCLKAAHSQPWTVLDPMPKQILSMLLKLRPKRRYYPEKLKYCQTVNWDDRLTATIQHEELANIAENILEQSHVLQKFDTSGGSFDNDSIVDTSPYHLNLRGIIRRQIYERIKCPSDSVLLSIGLEDAIYAARDRENASDKSIRVYQAIKALLDQCMEVPELPELKPMLERWEVVGRFGDMIKALNIQMLLEGDLPHTWGSYMQAFRSPNASKDCKSQLSLALLAFSQKCDQRIVSWLVTLAKYAALQDIEPPRDRTFTGFRLSEEPKRGHLKKFIKTNQDKYATFASRSGNGKKVRDGKLSIKKYDTSISSEAECIADLLIDQWPDVPSTLSEFEMLCKEELDLEYVDPSKAWTGVHAELQRLSDNLSLSRYILSLERAVERLQDQYGKQSSTAQMAMSLRPQTAIVYSLPTTSSIPISVYRVPQLTEILFAEGLGTGGTVARRKNTMSSPPANSHRPEDFDLHASLPSLPKEISTLHSIVQSFVSSRQVTRQRYGEDLERSIAALAWDLNRPQTQEEAPGTADLEQEIVWVQDSLSEITDVIRASISKDQSGLVWLLAGNLWPCESVVCLLELLRIENHSRLSGIIKDSLIQYGILITKLQRLLRIKDATRCDDQTRAREEKNHEGHSNWAPQDYPEWLLFEIDNDLLIRSVQVDVAKAIMSPGSKNNSVLQMNMGMGKTSCVIPMAILILANKLQLCRIIVPKALLLQTAQVIQGRIGGLLGRQVRHTPFSRRSPCSNDALDTYWGIHKDMLTAGGVMMCLPGHIMSFKLSGLQLLADNQPKPGRQMLEIQRWLETSCRDILDESDMTLSPNTQLIYPSGQFSAVDGHPYRWQVIEELLDLVESHTQYLQSHFEDKIEVFERHTGYPILLFLNSKPEEALNNLLIQDICDGRLSQIQFKVSTSDCSRHDVHQIISGVPVSFSSWKRAAESLVDEVAGLKILCLLRGLISERILLLCLKKRWNVQYGLHPERPPIAVPFEAKGVPSQAAEYGHPDTALLLTCLAFYQAGLTKHQIKQSLERVIGSDDPAASYDCWIRGCDSLPPALRFWNLIDPENELQVHELWDLLRYDRGVLKNYMNIFVFPFHAKQFSVKLQASGWDIPILGPPNTASCDNLTTGFSGTNDNKGILPQTIRQDDLPSLLSTNAEVLSYLLADRNAECYLAVNKGVRLTEVETLEFLYKNGIRILIDAGAHILEMGNYEVAEAWLRIDFKAQGAVFIGHNNQIMVHSRFQKHPVPLIASPFANNLEDCVVYIDEGHTRGTDLKLPVNAKGAVTLGLGQTKDQTVQAAMRLRKLGTTQSVAFIAPPEVYRSIIDVRAAHIQECSTPPAVTSIDVVRWLLEQSCKANEQMLPLHFSQCKDFCRRTNSLWKNPNFAANNRDIKRVLQVIQQKEEQTLESLYGPESQYMNAESLQLDFPQLQTYVSNIEERAQDGKPNSGTALMEVEQEREVVFQVEQVREKQISVRHEPLLYPGIHPTILKFIRTGYLDASDNSNTAPLLHAMEYIRTTKIGKKFGVKATASRLFVTREFRNTVTVNKSIPKQDILRPVDWILWSPSSQTALIVIPEEADGIITLLRKMKVPRVWLISYSAPVSKSMQIFNSLTYLTIPSWPKERTIPAWLGIEVGLVAGRLYFNYTEYESFLSWLGISENQQVSEVPCGLPIDQPLRFLQEWVANRRQTQDIMYTPVGFVCQNKGLDESHFFFGHPNLDPESGNVALKRAALARNEHIEDDGSDDAEWDEQEE